MNKKTKVCLGACSHLMQVAAGLALCCACLAQGSESGVMIQTLEDEIHLDPEAAAQLIGEWREPIVQELAKRRDSNVLTRALEGGVSFGPQVTAQLMKEWQEPIVQEAVEEYWSDPKVQATLSENAHGSPGYWSAYVQAVVRGIPKIPPEIRQKLPVINVFYSLSYGIPSRLQEGLPISPLNQESFQLLLTEKYTELAPEIRDLLAHNTQIIARSNADSEARSSNTQEAAEFRASVPDAFAALKPEEQAALASHMHLLSDRYALARTMKSASPETRAAIASFLTQSRLNKNTFSLSEEELVIHDEAEARGYYVSFAPVPEVIGLLEMAQKRVGPAGESGGYSEQHAQELLSLENLPVAYRLDEFERNMPHYATELRSVPTYAIVPNSDTYIFPARGDAYRVYSRSSFGGALLVREQIVSGVIFRRPNLTIAGHDAHFFLTKHESGHWTTTISAYDGKKSYEIEVSSKLEGPERDRFVQFARDLLAGS